MQAATCSGFFLVGCKLQKIYNGVISCMPTIELLNNKKHKELRVFADKISTVGCQFGNAMIMPSEFGPVQREYPILFRKDLETGLFYASAMLGFSSEENLFLKNGKWTSQYVPLTLRKGPFVIGFQDQDMAGTVVRSPVICVDVDDERVSRTAGDPVFTETGERSAFMASISQVLMEIHQGFEKSKEMISAFVDLGLIEPVSLSVKLNNDETVKLTGVYTINGEKLAMLNGSDLEKLNKSGFLAHAFHVVSSLENFNRLIDLKNSSI